MALPVLIRMAGLGALLLAALAEGSAPSGPPVKVHCLDCHPSHHADRGGCTDCHRGNPATDRKAVAHAGFLPAAYSRFTVPADPSTVRGIDRLSRSGCRRCHVSGGEGTVLAADLDAASGFRPGRLHDAILVPARYMPDFRFGEEAIRELVNAIYANGGKRQGGRSGGREIPVKVHFAPRTAESRQPPFAAHCGGCHRALSGGGQGMGSGAAGPNLSALFTPFHPGRPGPGSRWTPETLSRWVANPREFRPAALMPPRRVPPADLDALAASLGGVAFRERR